MRKQRIWRRAAVAGAVAASAVAAAPARAQVTFDFRTTDAGLVSENIVGNNPWTWVSGQGWRVNGVREPALSRVFSPLLTAAGGAFSVDLRHQFNFEDENPTSCFDGGVVFASINRGGLQQLTPTAGRGYTGPINTEFANPFGGWDAFCGNSGGFVSSVFSTNLTAGSTIQFVIYAGWDESFANSDPNWLLQSATINGMQQPPLDVIPEPSTYALLASGLGLVGLVARRRARLLPVLRPRPPADAEDRAGRALGMR